MIKYSNTKPNLDWSVSSFDYFARKFDDWHVVIHQSRRNYNTQSKIEENKSNSFVSCLILY